MTATERVHRLLDERGVEYRFNDATKVFEWHFDGTDGEGSAHATEVNGGVNIIACSLTPEQAVAATLGQGTCHDEGDPGDFCCSECGVRMFTDVSDTYTMIASDGRTIIKHPNFCPNCGKRIEVTDG